MVFKQSKHKDKKLEKATSKISKKKNVENKQRTPALIILAIMILSIGGFAMLGGGPSSSGTNDQGIPQNLPFQQFNQQGQTFWVAIINYEIFPFESIDGFEQNEKMANLALGIKESNLLQIYTDSNYTNLGDVKFSIEKYLNAVEKPYSYLDNLTQCNSNTLIISENITQEGCLEFESPSEESYINSQALTYHLVK